MAPKAAILLCALCCTSVVAAVDITHFDYVTYPDSSSITESQNVFVNFRALLVLPDLAVPFAKGTIDSLSILISTGNLNVPVTVMFWRWNGTTETYSLLGQVTSQPYTSTGTKQIEVSPPLEVLYNDVVGLLINSKYPVASVPLQPFVPYRLSVLELNDPLPSIGDSITIPAAQGSSRLFAITASATDGGYSMNITYGSGAKGEKGAAGAVGLKGAQGLKGSQGINGVKGARGEAGTIGLPGQKGEPGTNMKGEAGSTGDQGLKGPRGERGQIGPQGPQGQAGGFGFLGIQGKSGLQGPKGIAGLKGLRGFKGEPGVRGGPGDEGVKGEKGELGPRGSQGQGGPIGLPGPSIAAHIAGMTDKCSGSYNCGENAGCEDTLVGPNCICNHNFAFEDGSNNRCEAENPCTYNNGGCTNSKCEANGGCTCREGFAPEGNRCKAIDSCAKTPCSTSLQCLDISSGQHQCLPKAILVEEAPAIVAATTVKAEAQVKDVDETSIRSNALIIVFIMWAVILTVLVIVIAIWIAIELRHKRLDYEENFDFYGSRTHPASRPVTGMPSRFHESTFKAVK